MSLRSRSVLSFGIRDDQSTVFPPSNLSLSENGEKNGEKNGEETCNEPDSAHLPFHVRLPQDSVMNHSLEHDHRDQNPSLDALLLDELKALRARVAELEQEQSDLKIMHDTIVQHADEIEVELQRRYNELQDRNTEIINLNQQLEAAQRELQHLVRIDPLTQLANRRYLDVVLEQEWLRLGRDRKPLSLLMADIDFFKPYNDYYGHLAGDQCLIDVAQIFQTSIRRPDDVVARYGGEEIAVVLPNTDQNGAVAVAQKLVQAMVAKQIPHQASPVCDHVTVSIGVATMIPDLKQSVELLLRRADTALYQTKTKTRNGFTVYENIPPSNPDSLAGSEAS